MKQELYQHRHQARKQHKTRLCTNQAKKVPVPTTHTIEPTIHYPAPDLDNPANQQHERTIIGFTSTGEKSRQVAQSR
jgi:hypothetical protein